MNLIVKEIFHQLIIIAILIKFSFKCLLKLILFKHILVQITQLIINHNNLICKLLINYLLLINNYNILQLINNYNNNNNARNEKFKIQK